LVLKIELEKIRSLATATSIRFLANGANYTVKAKKEVIVCRGLVNSLQILELSSISSAAVLQNAAVEVIVESSRVGKNLVNYIATALTLIRAFYSILWTV
jgi:choline dehydrogenase